MIKIKCKEFDHLNCTIPSLMVFACLSGFYLIFLPFLKNIISSFIKNENKNGSGIQLVSYYFKARAAIFIILVQKLKAYLKQRRS